MTKDDTKNDYEVQRHLVRKYSAIYRQAKQDIDRLQDELRQSRLKRSLKRLENGITASDHAVLRYMERVKGVNVEVVRAELEAQIKAGDVSRFNTVVCSGFTAILREDQKKTHIVTTIVTGSYELLV